MGGIDATIAIRAREQGSGTRTPILALTANAMKSHEDQCLAVGMDGFLSKPFRKDALLDAVAGHARKHSATEGCGPSGGQGDAAGSTPASSELSAAAFDYRAAIAESDEEIVLLIAQLFLANTPDDLNRIAEALADGDSLIVGRLSHALSGLLGNFGATPLVILARSIEAAAAAGSLVGVDRQLTELKAGFAVLSHALENFLAAAGEPA
jgi:CheY-like chemotaxis protein